MKISVHYLYIGNPKINCHPQGTMVNTIFLSRQRGLFLLLFVPFLSLLSQNTYENDYSNKIYHRAIDFFLKEQYAASLCSFEKIIKNPQGYTPQEIEDAYFYRAMCAIELMNRDAENQVQQFLSLFPYSEKSIRASFHLGKYYFRKRNWKKVEEVFSTIKPEDIDENLQGEYFFRLGYAYFEQQMYEKAKPLFYKVIQQEDYYHDVSRYYYAYILYLEKNYTSALVHFEALKNNPKFAEVVPYYIIQIYYVQGRYKEVTEYASQLPDSVQPKRQQEIYKYLAESYYYLQNYLTAIQYYEKVLNEIKRNREYSYNLAECYRKTNQCERAIELYRYAIATEDSLAQVASYNMGHCYMKMNRKEYARNNFKTAATLNYNKALAEDALFNYVKLSYELSYHPFNDAVLAIEEFLNQYPNSIKKDEALQYLISIYYTTKNYPAAMQSIERLKYKTPDILAIYQKLAFLQGILLFNDQNYQDASIILEKSSQHNYDKNIYLQTIYWLGECHYRLNEYNKAATLWSRLLENPASITQPFYADIYYQIAYANWMQKNYPSAIEWFRKFINIEKQPTLKYCDALNRIADGYYIQRNFEWALEFYEKNTFHGKYEVDYSLYQSALCVGVIKNYQEKISLLHSLLNTYKNSDYTDDALFQLSETYLTIGEHTSALKYLQELYQHHPKSPYQAQTLLKIGLIYYNQNRDDEALQYFKMAVDKYPATEYAHSAIEKIKAIYLEKNDIAGFETYIQQYPFVQLSSASLDSASYYVAEKNYFSGDCQKAVNQFTAYLEKYPYGYFQIPALYYRAECEYKMNYKEEARQGYQKLLSLGSHRFLIPSIEKLADLSLQEKDWSSAAHYFELLLENPVNENTRQKACYHLAQLYYEMNNAEKSLYYSNQYLSHHNLEEQTRNKILLIKANILLRQNLLTEAEAIFKELSTQNSAIGAEAKYYLAFILYQRGEYTLTEKEIFHFVKTSPSYDYWITKSLILLADVYVSTDEILQAKQTLQSVVANTKYNDLRDIASEKLSIIIEKEKQRIKNENEEPILEELNIK